MRGGYRDRLLTELAQNAVDAAVAANIPARLWVRRVGETIRVANVGVPISRSGVEALSSLRASDKASAAGHTGRYGVGFTAVRTIANVVEVRSRDGSVRFDLDATADAVRERAIDTDALERHNLSVPGLRLPWPSAELPPDGWDTEIVLYPRAELDVDAVLAGLVADAPDVMLDLAGLTELTIGDPPSSLTRTVEHRDDGVEAMTITDRAGAERRWWVLASGSADADRTGHRQPADPSASASPVRWLWPEVDGRPGRASPDVLRAPTRSDEPLTLPALLVADLPLQPDRRRLMPTVDVAEIACGYAALVSQLPAADRTVAVPTPGLPAGPVDADIRAAIEHELRTQPWIDDTDGTRISGERAAVLPDVDIATTELFADSIPGLVHADMSTRRDIPLLRSVGVRVLGVADLVEALGGLSRPAAWWRRVYDVLEARVVDAVDRDNCGSLPVPLADGRLVTGPRTVTIADGLDPRIGVDWVRVVHPDAVHPLLATLGARDARPADLLADPALHERISILDDMAVDHPDDPETVEQARRLADTVLTLAASIDGALEPAAVAGLGALLLDDADGHLRAADELLLPDAPLRAVLADDAPVAVVADRWVEAHGDVALRRIGVGWDFTVVTDEAPTEPEHLLDDEQAWWAQLPAEPDVLVAVRDLDLVAADRWAEAIDMMLARPDTAAALADPDGYTCWWLRRHARVEGRSPALFAGGDGPFDGLLDRWPGRRTPPAGLLAGDVVADARQAAELLRRLADPERPVSGALGVDVHRLLGEAVAARRVDPVAVDPPERVRALSGAAIDPRAAYVLDRPWLAAVIDPHSTVVGSLAVADDLADLLDIDTASTALTARVSTTGSARQLADDPRWAAAAVAANVTLPSGRVFVHPELVVRMAGVPDTRVAYWCDETGVHVDELFGPAAVSTIVSVLAD